MSCKEVRGRFEVHKNYNWSDELTEPWPAVVVHEGTVYVPCDEFGRRFGDVVRAHMFIKAKRMPCIIISARALRKRGWPIEDDLNAVQFVSVKHAEGSLELISSKSHRKLMEEHAREMIGERSQDVTDFFPRPLKSLVMKAAPALEENEEVEEELESEEPVEEDEESLESDEEEEDPRVKRLRMSMVSGVPQPDVSSYASACRVRNCVFARASDRPMLEALMGAIASGRVLLPVRESEEDFLLDARVFVKVNPYTNGDGIGLATHCDSQETRDIVLRTLAQRPDVLWQV